jgi:hypothetical protein
MNLKRDIGIMECLIFLRRRYSFLPKQLLGSSTVIHRLLPGMQMVLSTNAINSWFSMAPTNNGRIDGLCNVSTELERGLL